MKTINTDKQIKGLRLRELHMRRWATAQLFARQKAGLADIRPNRHTRRALAKMARVLRRFPVKAKPAPAVAPAGGA